MLRYNSELCRLYDEPNNNKKIKRLAWTGHVRRMGKGRISRKLLLTKPDRKEKKQTKTQKEELCSRYGIFRRRNKANRRDWQ